MERKIGHSKLSGSGMADSEQQHKKRSRLCVTQSTNAVKGMVDVSDSADEGRIVCLYYKYVPVADVDAAIKDHEGALLLLGLRVLRHSFVCSSL